MISTPGKRSKSLNKSLLAGSASRAIKRISVENLFGRYSYSIPNMPSEAGEALPLLIVYGDNGAGKTTLLKLVYHILSPHDNSGHRGFLASTPFKTFTVELSDGTRITAERDEQNLTGTYHISIYGQDGQIFQCEVRADEELSVRKSEQSERYPELLAELAKFQVSVYFLSDDRELQGDMISPSNMVIREMRENFLETEFRLHVSQRARRVREDDSQHERVLIQAIEGAREWILRQALSGSSLGEKNTNTIYTDVAKLIAKPGHSQDNHEDISSRTQATINKLKEVATRSQSFSQFGLASPFDAEELLHTIGNSNPERQQIIVGVLNPFIDGLEARLDALQDVHEVITTLINNINNFYSDKSVTFDIRKGFDIILKGSGSIAPQKLSSGEKQLLLLLCNTISARSQKSVFIIDEPELSLNIKWQRMLVPALLDCIKGSQVQFILATHSFELLAHQRQYVQRLDRTN